MDLFGQPFTPLHRKRSHSLNDLRLQELESLQDELEEAPKPQFEEEKNSTENNIKLYEEQQLRLIKQHQQQSNPNQAINLLNLQQKQNQTFGNNNLGGNQNGGGFFTSPMATNNNNNKLNITLTGNQFGNPGFGMGGVGYANLDAAMMSQTPGIAELARKQSSFQLQDL
eukprot:Pgem_evm1s5495